MREAAGPSCIPVPRAFVDGPCFAAEGAPHVKTVLQRHAQVEATDRDAERPLVYELYGLTDDEIAVVEG